MQGHKLIFCTHFQVVQFFFYVEVLRWSFSVARKHALQHKNLPLNPPMNEGQKLLRCLFFSLMSNVGRCNINQEKILNEGEVNLYCCMNSSCCKYHINYMKFVVIEQYGFIFIIKQLNNVHLIQQKLVFCILSKFFLISQTVNCSHKLMNPVDTKQSHEFVMCAWDVIYLSCILIC